MTTNASETTKPVPMGDLAKDVGLEHKLGPDKAQRSVGRIMGKLFGRAQNASPKKR